MYSLFHLGTASKRLDHDPQSLLRGLNHNRRRSSWRIQRTSALLFCLATTLFAAAPAVADNKVLVESHVGNLGASDPIAGAIVVTGGGDRVKINSFTANGRCTVEFYNYLPLAQSVYQSTGMLMLIGLTDDQAPGTLALAAQNDQQITKLDLSVAAGDQIAILLPALMPGTGALGFPLTGSCGNHLVSLKADTDAGELDWDFSK